MQITRNNREEIEKEFIALVMNKPEVIDELIILPKWLMDSTRTKLLEVCIDCYKDIKYIDLNHILEKNLKLNNSDFIDLFMYYYLEEFYYDKAYEQQLKYSQESIIKFYKEDILNELNEKLKNKKIDYSEYMKKVKKLDEIKISEDSNTILSIKEINLKEEDEERVLSNLLKLDERIKGFALGQLSVWSGSNASAKSTYLNQIAIESINQGYNVAIYSGELIASKLLKWIIMQCSGKRNMEYYKKKDYWYVPDEKKSKIINWLDKKLFIYNNESGNKAGNIINSIKKCIKTNNVKVVIIDNLMSMNLSDYGDNKYDTQSYFVQSLSALAKECNVHIHFVCHPRKVTSFLRKIDISGSADLTNIADNVFIMHRVNNDFKIKTKEAYKWNDSFPLYSYDNVLEVCKNRDFGVEDFFVGMYFEIESKRMLNVKEEPKYYKWETDWNL